MVRRLLKYAVLLAVAAMMVSCGARDGKVIPRKKLAKIYADMFMADQWIQQNYTVSKVADTSQVYKAIFEDYGYSSDDYRKSVAYYIQDPDRFARILRQTVSILDERISDDKAELRKMKSEESAKTDITYRFDFDRIWIFDNGFPRLADRDSLDYFTDKGEYFILDLKHLVEPLEYDSSVYFPQDSLKVTGNE